jgi:hypothetical protein
MRVAGANGGTKIHMDIFIQREKGCDLREQFKGCPFGGHMLCFKKAD